MDDYHIKLNNNKTYPLIGLGTDKIRETMTEAVDAALASGYRLFDTAKVYGNESFLGEAINKLLPKYNISRKDIMLQTKVLPTNKESVRNDVEDSLEKLKTNFLDVVLIHYPKQESYPDDDEGNPGRRRETYLALEELKAEGKIGSIGVSNYEQRHIEELLEYAKELPVLNQIELHPHFTRRNLLEYCKKVNIVVQAFSSLARQNSELMTNENLLRIAREHDSDPSHILLSWATSQQIPIIPKSSNPQRIESNMVKVRSTRLTPEEIVELNKLDRGKNYVGRCVGWLVR